MALRAPGAVRTAVVAALLAVSATLTTTATAAADPDASGDGPPLETPTAELENALECTDDVGTSDQRTVLLVHGTGATPSENFSWSYFPFLEEKGYPYCTVTVPQRAMGDLQHNVEFVVHAIRRAYELSGDKIAIVGHSQGATLPAYALRMWPDLAPMVEDFISYAGAFEHGTSLANLACLLPCAKAFRQFRPGSRFLAQMAKHPMPEGPSYTAFATRYDEIVTPQPKASRLNAPGAQNYLLQDLCPVDVAEHLTIIAEKPFFALALDALEHPGPGELSRVDLQCGFDRHVVQSLPHLVTFGLGTVGSYGAELSTVEPPLRAYWHAG